MGPVMPCTPRSPPVSMYEKRKCESVVSVLKGSTKLVLRRCGRETCGQASFPRGSKYPMFEASGVLESLLLVVLGFRNLNYLETPM